MELNSKAPATPLVSSFNFSAIRSVTFFRRCCCCVFKVNIDDNDNDNDDEDDDNDKAWNNHLSNWLFIISSKPRIEEREASKANWF